MYGTPQQPTRELLGDSLDLVVEEEADGPDVVGPDRRVEHGSAAVQPHAGVDVSAIVDEQRHHGEAGLGGGGAGGQVQRRRLLPPVPEGGVRSPRQ